MRTENKMKVFMKFQNQIKKMKEESKFKKNVIHLPAPPKFRMRAKIIYTHKQQIHVLFWRGRQHKRSTKKMYVELNSKSAHSLKRNFAFVDRQASATCWRRWRMNGPLRCVPTISLEMNVNFKNSKSKRIDSSKFFSCLIV